MTTNQAIRTGRHCAFMPHAHLVLVRHRVFADRQLTRTEEIMRSQVELVESALAADR